MSVLSITNSAPSERRLTGGLFLLAGLAALGALATNIILPAFPRIGDSLGVSSQELGLTLSSLFVAFAFRQLPGRTAFRPLWPQMAGAGRPCSLCYGQCPLCPGRHEPNGPVTDALALIVPATQREE
jgi:hypothetical protein